MISIPCVSSTEARLPSGFPRYSMDSDERLQFFLIKTIGEWCRQPTLTSYDMLGEIFDDVEILITCYYCSKPI